MVVDELCYGVVVPRLCSSRQGLIVISPELRAAMPDSAVSLWLCNRRSTSLINSAAAPACRRSELPSCAGKQDNILYILNILCITIIYWIYKVIFTDPPNMFASFLLYSFLWPHVQSCCLDQLAPGRRVWSPVTSAFLPLPPLFPLPSLTQVSDSLSDITELTASDSSFSFPSSSSSIHAYL